MGRTAVADADHCQAAAQGDFAGVVLVNLVHIDEQPGDAAYAGSGQQPVNQ